MFRIFSLQQNSVFCENVSRKSHPMFSLAMGIKYQLVLELSIYRVPLYIKFSVKKD